MYVRYILVYLHCIVSCTISFTKKLLRKEQTFYIDIVNLNNYPLDESHCSGSESFWSDSFLLRLIATSKNHVIRIIGYSSVCLRWTMLKVFCPRHDYE